MVEVGSSASAAFGIHRHAQRLAFLSGACVRCAYLCQPISVIHKSIDVWSLRRKLVDFLACLKLSFSHSQVSAVRRDSAHFFSSLLRQTIPND